MKPGSAPVIRPWARRSAEVALRVMFDGYIRTTVSGQEHIPPPGVASIVATNHVSDLDVFAAGFAVGRKGYFLAKEEATRIPLFGPYLKAVGAIPARRDGDDVAALRTMLAVLKAGHLLGVAPEGTRSPDGRLGAYDAGFVWLAARTGAVIVPGAIHGTWQLMPKGASYPRRGPAWVRFGPPVQVVAEGRLGGARGRERRDAIAAEVRATTLDMLLDLAAETGVATPAADLG